MSSLRPLSFLRLMRTWTLWAFVGVTLSSDALAAPPAEVPSSGIPGDAGITQARPGATIDRTIVRFDAAETGGRALPRFIFERELAFEARLEALADADRSERGKPYMERHVRAALERHIAEELLAHLVVDPQPTTAELTARTDAAREALEHRVGGRVPLEMAAAAERLEPFEVERVIVREARASLYIDRMITPMLEPSEAELREVHRTASPFRDRPFDEAAPFLRRWYIADRLDAALQTFYQNARGRIHLVFM